MSYRIEQISDQATWDGFVTESSPSSLFQSWPWGEVERAVGARVWRFGLFQGSQLAGVFQVFAVRARRGPFLHVRHGPIFKNQSREAWNAVLSFLRELALRERVWFVRLGPQIPDTSGYRALLLSLGVRPAPMHGMDAEFCWVLDIGKSDEELLSLMRKTTRYEIRRAEKLGVEVVVSQKDDGVAAFLELYKKTSKRHGFVPHHAVAEEFSIFSKNGRALLLAGFYEGKLLAGAVVLFYGNQAIYHHGASLPSKVPVSYLVQWRAIMEAKKRGMKLYNLWGIAPDDKQNHPWRGITLFKKGFGGREISYIHAHDYPTSPLYVVPHTIETIRRLTRGY